VQGHDLANVSLELLDAPAKHHAGLRERAVEPVATPATAR
jgi:hypothetical protein